MDISSTASSSSASLLTAVMAKKRQEQEGAMTLQLLQKTVESTPPAPTSTAHNIDIRV